MALDSGLMMALTCLLRRRHNNGKMEAIDNISINGQHEMTLMTSENQTLTAPFDSKDVEELPCEKKISRKSEETDTREASL